jgi:U3 small nucleolar RNA-associated protein 20
MEETEGEAGEASDEDAGAAAPAPPARRALLEGLVSVLVRSSRSRDAATAEGSLRALATLCPLKLTQLTSAAPALAKRLHALLRRVSSHGGEAALAERLSTSTQNSATGVGGAALRLWGALLRAVPSLSPTPAQSALLFTCAAADLRDPASAGAAFSLLRALLARSPLPPEAHSLMASVRNLLLTAHAPAVRGEAAQTLLHYLLAAPLGERRFGEQLDFLVVNLGYAHADGRMAVLRLLAALVARLPPSAAEQHALFLLLPLVARLTGDTDARVRALAADAVAALLRASDAAAQAAVRAASAWLATDGAGTDADVRLRRCGAQVLGLAVDVAPAAVQRCWRAAVLPSLAAALARCVSDDAAATETAVSGAAGSEGGEGAAFELSAVTAPGWQVAYYTLLLLEKLWRSPLQPLLTPDDAEQPLWSNSTVGMALHRHAWVRAASARLLGAYASRCAADGVIPSIPGGGLLASAGLRSAANAQVRALEAGGLGDAAVCQCVKNLVFLCAAQLRRAGGEDEAEAKLAAWLLRRVAAVGAPGQPGEMRLAVLRFCAGVGARCKAQGVRLSPQFAQALLTPCFSATEGAAENAEAAVKSLGGEALAALRDALPPADFSAAFAAARAAAQQRRLKRKRERALEDVLDVQAAARRRAAKAAKKKQHLADVAAERKAHKAKGTVAPVDAQRRVAKVSVKRTRAVVVEEDF